MNKQSKGRKECYHDLWETKQMFMEKLNARLRSAYLENTQIISLGGEEGWYVKMNDTDVEENIEEIKKLIWSLLFSKD